MFIMLRFSALATAFNALLNDGATRRFSVSVLISSKRMIFAPEMSVQLRYFSASPTGLGSLMFPNSPSRLPTFERTPRPDRCGSDTSIIGALETKLRPSPLSHVYSAQLAGGPFQRHSESDIRFLRRPREIRFALGDPGTLRPKFPYGVACVSSLAPAGLERNTTKYHNLEGWQSSVLASGYAIFPTYKELHECHYVWNTRGQQRLTSYVPHARATASTSKTRGEE